MKTAAKEDNVEQVATTAATLALEQAEKKRRKEDKAKRSRKRAARSNSRNVPGPNVTSLTINDTHGLIQPMNEFSNSHLARGFFFSLILNINLPNRSPGGA